MEHRPARRNGQLERSPIPLPQYTGSLAPQCQETGVGRPVGKVSVDRESPCRAPVSPAASVRSLLLSPHFSVWWDFGSREGRFEEIDPHRAILRGTTNIALNDGRHALHGELACQVRALELDQVRDVPAQRRGEVAVRYRLPVVMIRAGLIVRTEIVVQGRNHALGEDGPPRRLPFGTPALADPLAEDRAKVGADEHGVDLVDQSGINPWNPRLRAPRHERRRKRPPLYQVESFLDGEPHLDHEPWAIKPGRSR